MAFVKTTFALALIACVAFQIAYAHQSHHERKEMRRKRSTENDQQKTTQKQPAWQPATGPREFTVNVDDNIQGANQHRHEKWNNGTVTGSYAAPGRDGKWLKYEYIGDSKGFRITSTKELSDDQLTAGSKSAGDNAASINIQADQQQPVQYTVTEDELAKSKEKHEKELKQNPQAQNQ